MSNWTTYKLGDIINVKHGFAFKGEFFSDEATKDILLTPGNFKIGGGFKTDKLKYYKGVVPEDYVLNEGDILITMTDLSKAGDTLGYSAKIPPHAGVRYLHNQRLGLVQFKSNEVDEDYLYWVLRTQPYQYYIVGSATGSTVKHTSPTRICSYEFSCPTEKEEQQSIASILSSLDNKIDLNLQMNQTLETMAQAIFKEWFVNFNFPDFDGELVDGLPKGWKMGKLSDISDVIDCLHSKKPERVETYTGYIFLQLNNIMDNGLLDLSEIFWISDIDYKKWTSRIEISEGDCVITNVGRVGVVARIPKNVKAALGRNMTGIRLRREFPYFGFLITLLTSDIIKIEIEKKKDFGTILEALNVKNIPKLSFPLPPLKILNEFDKVVSTIWEKMEENVSQNSSLTQIRDSLLPKLMTGKIETEA